jgi:enamidase
MWKKILIGIGCLLLILFIASYFIFQTGLFKAKKPQKGALALTNGHFITMASDTSHIVSDKALLIENGEITGFRSSEELSAEVKTKDLNGGYAMPGLMDLHVHLGGIPFIEDFGTVDMILEYMRQYPLSRKKFLKYGVTTVQSLGDMHPQTINLSKKISGNKLAGPRIFAAGPILTAPDGHPVSTIFKGRDRAIKNATRQLKDTTRAKKVVDSLASDGVDKIKVVYSAGPDSTLPQMKYNVLDAIVEEAHNQELRVVAHIDSRYDIRNAMRAGVDGIEHIIQNTTEVTSLPEKMAAKDLYVVPTLSVYKSLMDSTKFNTVLDLFSNWLNHDIKIALGTDTGNIPAGESVYEEMKLYARAGMDPYRILQTATINAAHHIKAEKKLGSLKPGKYADIIVFDQNPLDNIQTLEKPSWVFRSGTAYISPE